jgi:hypothetical protein
MEKDSGPGMYFALSVGDNTMQIMHFAPIMQTSIYMPNLHIYAAACAELICKFFWNLLEGLKVLPVSAED